MGSLIPSELFLRQVSGNFFREMVTNATRLARSFRPSYRSGRSASWGLAASGARGALTFRS